jgi:hypothetical protein
MRFTDREHKQVCVCEKEKKRAGREEAEQRKRKSEDGARIIILIISISSYGTEQRVISRPHYLMARNSNRYRTSHN